MERISVNVASKELHMTPQAVRIRMERDLFNPPIGFVMPGIQGERLAYYVYREKLDEFLGRTNNEKVNIDDSNDMHDVVGV